MSKLLIFARCAYILGEEWHFDRFAIKVHNVKQTKINAYLRTHVQCFSDLYRQDFVSNLIFNQGSVNSAHASKFNEHIIMDSVS